MATRLNMLPEDCVSTIVSLTSAADACRLMLASSSLQSAAESDMVWSRFLSFDHSAILSRTHSQINFSSKKELYFKLCDSVLIDGGIRVSLIVFYFLKNGSLYSLVKLLILFCLIHADLFFE